MSFIQGVFGDKWQTVEKANLPGEWDDNWTDKWDPLDWKNSMKYLSKDLQNQINGQIANPNMVINDRNLLMPEMRNRLFSLLDHIREEHGLDPRINETWRSQDRQQMLYKKRSSWTLKSKHKTGNAADIISDKYLWGGNTVKTKDEETKAVEFYDILQNHLAKFGLKSIKKERCHVQFDPDWKPEETSDKSIIELEGRDK